MWTYGHHQAPFITMVRRYPRESNVSLCLGPVFDVMTSVTFQTKCDPGSRTGKAVRSACLNLVDLGNQDAHPQRM